MRQGMRWLLALGGASVMVLLLLLLLLPPLPPLPPLQPGDTAEF